MKKFVAVIVVTACFLALNSANAEVIWSSGFESGDFSDWTSASGNWWLVKSSSGAHSEIYRASIKGTTSPNGDVLLLAESTVGYENLQWSYWYKINDALESDDYVFAEWSANQDGDWQVLAEYTKLANSDWQYASFSLPESADNNPLCQFRFRAILQNPSDIMSFDDVSLSTMVSEPNFFILILPILFCAMRRRKIK